MQLGGGGLISVGLLFVSLSVARADNPGGPSLLNRDPQVQTVRLSKGAKNWTVRLAKGKPIALECDSFALGDQTVKVDPESTYWIEGSKIQHTVIAR